MADAIPLLAPLPMGDGPGRAHKKLRRDVGAIARRVEGHRRHDLHVWHLVAKMLAAMGYGR